MHAWLEKILISWFCIRKNKCKMKWERNGLIIKGSININNVKGKEFKAISEALIFIVIF